MELDMSLLKEQPIRIMILLKFTHISQMDQIPAVAVLSVTTRDIIQALKMVNWYVIRADMLVYLMKIVIMMENVMIVEHPIPPNYPSIFY